MTVQPATAAPTVLFGAFDRHNFGDLLFAHIAVRMLGRPHVYLAGIERRDLRPFGGHEVAGIADLVRRLGGQPVDLIHVGGELLTCDSWEAVVMLSAPEQVATNIAAERDWRNDKLGWSRKRLGVATLAPYVLSNASFPDAPFNRVYFHAVGGVDLDARDPALREQVLKAVRGADGVSVRDRRTQAALEAAGIAAPLLPDPAVMVAPLFGTTIEERTQHEGLRAVLKAFPGGYAAVQFSAEFGDDATLDALARQLTHIVVRHRLGIALFRAGAAPWHDDLACYARLASRMRAAPVRLFTSLNIWDVCALIAHSRLYCGSSLHGRIVALSFARAHVNFAHPAGAVAATKQAAFAATWEGNEAATVVGVADLAEAVGTALGRKTTQFAETAEALANRYREGVDRLRAALG